MKTMQLILRRFFLFFLLLLLFMIVYAGFSFLLSYIPVNTKPKTKPGKNIVYAHSNGVHLDLVFPLAIVPERLKSQLTHSSDTRLLAIGWGDRGFYLDTPTWAELRPSVAFKAMLLPSPTVMHVTEHSAVSANWSLIDLTDEQLDQLWGYVDNSFRKDTANRITELMGKGYTESDRFYEATGSYSCFKTCNTWVNTGLRQIGVKTAVWTPLDKGVLRYLPLVELTNNPVAPRQPAPEFNTVPSVI